MHQLIPALLLGFVLVGCQASVTLPATGSGTPTSQSATGAQIKANAADQAFLDGMVPHHEMALMMADDALAKGNHAELRAFATKVKEDQAREIAQMKAYRQQWFGSASTPMMDHGGMTGHGSMMIAAGATFDKEWAEEMIKHHQDAIDMAKLALSAAARPETKVLAQAIIDAQGQEQTQLRGYITAWK